MPGKGKIMETGKRSLVVWGRGRGDERAEHRMCLGSKTIL